MTYELNIRAGVNAGKFLFFWIRVGLFFAVVIIFTGISSDFFYRNFSIRK